jgi:hypothetical protein
MIALRCSSVSCMEGMIASPCHESAGTFHLSPTKPPGGRPQYRREAAVGSRPLAPASAWEGRATADRYRDGALAGTNCNGPQAGCALAGDWPGHRRDHPTPHRRGPQYLCPLRALSLSSSFSRLTTRPSSEPWLGQSIGGQVRRQSIVGILGGRSPSWRRPFRSSACGDLNPRVHAVVPRNVGCQTKERGTA